MISQVRHVFHGVFRVIHVIRLPTAKIQKKSAVCKFFIQKVSILTLEFNEIQ